MKSIIAQRTTHIAQTLNAVLQYEKDRCCLSDLIDGNIDQLRAWMRHLDARMDDHPYRSFTVRGYMYVELTRDNIDITEPSFTSVSMLKYRNRAPVIQHYDDHIATINGMYDRLSNAEPLEYRAAPMTHISCDDPHIDHWIDGHVDALTAIEDLNRTMPDIPKMPNGPAPVIIKHTAEMLPVRTGDAT